MKSRSDPWIKSIAVFSSKNVLSACAFRLDKFSQARNTRIDELIMDERIVLVFPDRLGEVFFIKVRTGILRQKEQDLKQNKAVLEINRSKGFLMNDSIMPVEVKINARVVHVLDLGLNQVPQSFITRVDGVKT